MKCTIKVSEVKETEAKNASKENESKMSLKGFATVVFGDSFKVTNIAILENKEDKSLFISMPRYRGKAGEGGTVEYKNICNPTTKEFRELLYGAILAAYQAGNFDKITFNDPGETMNQLDFNVQVTPFQKKGSNVRGLARVYLDQEFVINHITILHGKSGEFITMPNYKTKKVFEDNRPVYQDICYPITKEFRDKLYGQILEVYQQKIMEAPPLPLPPADEEMELMEKETPFR